ncbi:cephalosporin hydroxylase family protein [Sporichthya polymorpha]|uniref:cephalosporin hydroxylase family protein n=1 Tax=Sporichthya polymorpha TaxID=35751 RepID=UPI00037D45F4|nr:CmcI family methyltransferase [Sporichthya polymorpha]
MPPTRLTIDTEAATLVCSGADGVQEYPLYSPDAFRLLSEQWVNVGWALKYTYGFTWFGRPIIQLPEDIVRIQELIYRLRPDVIVETGVAHGGSLILYASLFEAMGTGRVIGVDIEIRPHNRTAIESHELAHRITLVEGDAVSRQTVEQVRSHVRDGERVLVLLDSNHTRDHVLAELRAYAPLVSPDSYLVATDGLMQQLTDVPRGKPEWLTDNPQEAARIFATETPDFVIEEPSFPFNEGEVSDRVTHWPSAYLRRVR